MQIFLNYEVFLYLMIVKILANSADPDEMQYYAAFHLGLHSFAKVPVYGFPVYKGLTLIAPMATKDVCFSRLLKCLTRSLYDKQCGPRSD